LRPLKPGAAVIRLLDYFFILRPILFFPGWTTTLAGYLCAKGLTDPAMVWTQNPDLDLLVVCVASAMLMGAGFIVNQIYDADTDRLNNKLFFLAKGFVPTWAATAEAILLLIAALTSALFISHTMLLLFIMAALLFTIIYNSRPLALKDRVLGSFAANALMGLFAFAYGWFAAGGSLNALFIDSVPYIFYNTSLYFLTTIPDAHGDGRTSKRTLCVVYGVRTTIQWALAFELIAIAWAAVRSDVVILIPATLVLPWYALLLKHPTREAVIRAIKLGLFFFAVMVGIYFPVFVLLILFFFFFTRWYYEKRFDMTYPNFKGE
jgi:4-hydroxybenzoate polyprenyltransferase